MLSDLNLSDVKSIPVSLVLTSVLLSLVAYYVVQRTRHELRIRKIGGVKAPSVGTNPITGGYRTAIMVRAQLKTEFLEFYNGLYRFATPASPNCVEMQVSPRQRFLMTRDPEHIKTILTTKFTDFGKGPSFHELWRPFLGDSIFTTDKAQWHDSRGLIRPMFIKDRVSDLATFDRWATALISKLPPSGQTVDIMDLLYRMTLDVTTDFLFGGSCNSLDNPRSEFARAFNDVQAIQMMLTAVGPFHVLVPRWRYYRAIAKIDEFVMPYIERALAVPQEELAKLSSSSPDFTFLHSIVQYTRDPKILRDQIVAVLLAGRDTTAATLSWCFYQISHYPEKYARLREEVLSTVGRDRAPTYDDLKGMTYMRHVLNETLRLYPAVPYNIRAALEDTTIPSPPGHMPISVVEGDVVIYSTLAMQRRKDLYPPASEKFADPDLFSPERWENWSPKPWQFVPFNGGPRICVGQNFAMTEMAYTMVKIVQKYERLEYRGDWHAQKHEAEIVGRPSDGVRLGLFSENPAGSI
ncbi:cytochrome P450 [Poronia punctata]|nr:cytochrome P450 [Poronia punctata]